MSVKPLMFEETPFYSKQTDKFSIFAEDIREIIKNRIDYCEIENMPYSATTAQQDLAYKANKIAQSVFYRETGRTMHNSTGVSLFSFSKKRDDKQTRFYVHFDVDTWEKLKGACNDDT